MNVSFRFAYQIVSFIDTKKEIFRVEGERRRREREKKEREREREAPRRKRVEDLIIIFSFFLY